jgi:hypothetical protein
MAGSALGAEKTAAKRAGVSLEEYRSRRANGEKWCFACRSWHAVGMFGRDASRRDGLESKCLQARATGKPKGWQGKSPINPKTGRPGPQRKPAVSGDKLQARYRVNKEISQGKIPAPRDLPCSDCGHVWVSDEERRHEYDHHLGYGAEHHLSVEAVCQPCHRKRERARKDGR